jgi:small subunit ribosomal protein S15
MSIFDDLDLLLTNSFAFVVLSSRGYRSSAILRRGSSSGGKPGPKTPDLGKLFPSDAKSSTRDVGVGKKDSFDDFFESLMKGHGQNSNAATDASTAGGVNLDSILSSLNKPVTEINKKEADSRFTEMFERRATAEAKEEGEHAKEEGGDDDDIDEYDETEIEAAKVADAKKKRKPSKRDDNDDDIFPPPKIDPALLIDHTLRENMVTDIHTGALKRVKKRILNEEFKDEFEEFMSALMASSKSSSKSSSNKESSSSVSDADAAVAAGMAIPEDNLFGSPVPKFDINLPENIPFLGKMDAQQARAYMLEELKKSNPELLKQGKWRGPIVSRSEMEADMEQTDRVERRHLDEAFREIKESGDDLPPYVTSIRHTDPRTGESEQVDLLAAYVDSDLPEFAKAALMNEDGAAMKELLSTRRGEKWRSIEEKMAKEAEESSSSSTSEKGKHLRGKAAPLANDEMESDEELLNSPEIASMFAALNDEAKQIEDMEYWSLFPKAVKRWIIYTRTPKGYYNDHGEWVASGPPPGDDKSASASSSSWLSSSSSSSSARESSGNESSNKLRSIGEQFGVGEEEEAAAEESLMMMMDKSELEHAHSETEINGLIGREHGRGDAFDDKDELLENEDDILNLVNEHGVSIEDALDEATMAAKREQRRLRTERFLNEEDEDLFAAGDEHSHLNLSSKNGKGQDWQFWEGVYQNEQQYLPVDLQGKFRFHIQPEEIQGMHPRLRRHFSFKFATEGEISKYRAAEYIRKWGKHPGDTGNSAVQIAILTLRINNLTKTLRTHTTDTHNGYRLQTLIRRRKGLMKHLKKSNLMTYYSLLKDIKLRDQVELWTAARK